MSSPPVQDRHESRFRSLLRSIGRRWEVVIPLLGILTFTGMTGSTAAASILWPKVVVYGLAAAHAVIVLVRPMRVPAKRAGLVTGTGQDQAPRVLDWPGVWRAARVIVPAVVVGVVISMIVRAIEGRGGEGSTLWGLVSIALIAVLGSLGLASERHLSVDLLPVFRRREVLRFVYVLVAALALAMVSQLWAGVTGDLAQAIGERAFGESELDVEGAASSFSVESPLRLLVSLLIGAGLFEELLFRLGILTLVWAFTRRFGLALVVSALVFGLYHITPLSGMDAYTATPVTAVLASAAMGVYMGLIYRYRGFLTAVLVHGLGDWIVILLISSMQS